VRSREFVRFGFAVAMLAATVGAAAVDSGRASSSAAPEFTVASDRPLVDNFGGFGAQFNQHLYAAISGPPPNLAELEQLVSEARPQFVRVFFNTTALTDADRMSSFLRTVELARRSEAELNVTWQGSSYAVAVASMPRFASVIAEVLKARTGSWVWVTLFNEPNSTRLTPAQYEDVYRKLDDSLRALEIRDRVRFMGGDLLGTASPLGQSQVDWFGYMAGQMGDLLDAWSVHIYWDFWDAGKIEKRLTEVRAIADSIPASLRRPLYVTEFGVRGVATFEGEENFQPGQWPDGTPMTLTTTAAFQQAWFLIRAAQLGYVATVKWDMYAAKYDSGTQDHSEIGFEAGTWTPRPVYRLLQLMTRATQPRNGRTVTVTRGGGVPKTRMVTAYVSPGQNLTVFGLDTRGGLIETADDAPVGYSIGGLPPNSLFRLLLWNTDGIGSIKEIGYLESGADGVIQVSVPLRAMFTLTDTPLPALPW
jgi:hypothetical protein